MWMTLLMDGELQGKDSHGIKNSATFSRKICSAKGGRVQTRWERENSVNLQLSGI
jgi:hypothetical protein